MITLAGHIETKWYIVKVVYGQSVIQSPGTLVHLYNHSCSCVCPQASTMCYFGHATEWLEYTSIQIDPLKIIGLQRLCVFKFPAYQDRKRWAFSNIVFRAVELRFVCNNHAIQYLSLPFHLTIFLSTGDFFLKIELLLLPQQ